MIMRMDLVTLVRAERCQNRPRLPPSHDPLPP
jgi:hypothetical protein